MRKPLLLVAVFVLLASLLLQAPILAFAFSTTITSGVAATLTSAQRLDVKNACLNLNLGTSTFCTNVSLKTVTVKETGDPGISLTVKESKRKEFLLTLSGAVIGATVNSVEFKTQFGDGKFDGSADHAVTTSWGSVYFEKGQRSKDSPMTIQIDIQTDPLPSQLGSISGTVTSNGSPVKGATVTATMQGNPSVTGQSTTDPSGQYAITGLVPGTYDLQAAASSYESKLVVGAVVSAGTSTTVDFDLILLPCDERPVKDFLGVGFIDKLLGRRESGGPTSSNAEVTENMLYIRQNGFTAIRVPYYWESHVYNSVEFMDRIEFIAKTAQENGICVFYVNFHYYTTSYWGLEIPNKSPGRGFPSFVVKDFPPMNNDYIQTAGPFWNAFLSNSIVIDGNKVWDVNADFIKSIISRVDSYDSTAGYEILNEPQLFDKAQYDMLGNYHTDMAEKIRLITDKKIFFDRENTWGFSRDPTLEPSIAPRGIMGIVYAPHLYSVPYPGSQAEEQINNFKTWSQDWGSEVLIGELAPDTQSDADLYLKVLKDNGFGWTVWSWRPIQGGLDNSYYESDAVQATEALKILLAAMAKVY